MKKHIFKIATVAVLTMGFATSCTDMLKEPTYAATTTEQFLKDNPDNFNNIVGQVYADIKWLHDHWTYWGLCTLTTDEAVCPVRQPGNHWADSNFWEQLNTHTWDQNGEAFNNVWYYCNHGAVECNKILDMLETQKSVFTEEQYNQYKAELVVVRSFYYYTLFDCFGRIPYTEKYSGEFVDLASTDSTWKHLVTVLEENAPNMPLATEPSWVYNYARATKGMAYTLLARLYLNAESYDVSAATISNVCGEKSQYDKCVESCNNVINQGVYSIANDFFEPFAIHNGNCIENIFVIQEDGSANNVLSGGNPMNKFRVSLLTMHYQHEQVWKTRIKPWNGFVASEEYLALFDEADYRGLSDASIEAGGTRVEGTTGATGRRAWFVGPVYNADDTEVAIDENGDRVVISAKLYGYDTEYQFAFAKGQKLTKAKQKQIDRLNAYLKEIGYEKTDYKVGDTLPKDDALVKSWNAALNAKYEKERMYTKAPTIDNITWNSGARGWKYEADKEGAYTYNENDFVFFRYADVLYMKVEAMLRGGKGDDLGMDEMQKIRTRVGLDAIAAGSFTLSTDPTDKNSIYNERAREFAWETVHRRDMIRFNTYTNSIWGFVKKEATGAGQEFRKWFPIHRDVLSAEPRWKQNEGY